MRNALINLMGYVLPLSAAVIAIPFLIVGLGRDRFGALTLIWTLFVYLSLFDLGISRALTKIVAERIRAMIESYDFSTGHDFIGRLTATVGHATYPIHATTKDEMIELADKAMYIGKNDRNVARSASEVRGT